MPAATKPISPKGEAEHLRWLVQSFVRSFGLLVTKETPCGQPIAPSYAHALMVLLERARDRSDTSQADLGSVLGIDKSNVTRLCSRMEAADHVLQERAPNDGRSRLLTLTPRGTRMAERIEKASHERFARIVAALPTDNRSTIFASLAALNEAVETLRDERPRQ